MAPPAMDLKCPCCRNPWQLPVAAASGAPPPPPAPDAKCGDCVQSDKDWEIHRGLFPWNMDKTADPAENFFQYANGGWMAANPCPPEYSAWGSFHKLADDNLTLLREIAEEASSARGEDPLKELVGAFWASGIEPAGANALGLQPIADLVAHIDALDVEEGGASHLVALLHTQGVNVLFGLGDAPDARNSGVSIAQVHQGGLGLPDRDYYFDDDKAETRALYAAHVATMLGLLAPEQPRAHLDEVAAEVVALESALASKHLTRTARRDPEVTYNKHSMAELMDGTPGGLSWVEYFKCAGKPHPGDINVDNPAFFVAMNRLLADTPLPTVKAYLKWHVVNAMAPYLSEEVEAASFEFMQKQLTGQAEMKPRWKRLLNQMNASLGEAVGQLYVAKCFPPEAKAKCLEIVGAVRGVLEERLRSVEWMSEPTRKEALRKMEAFGVKIGYPDKWVDYCALQLDRASYCANVRACNAFEHRLAMDRIDCPVDRSRWLMAPQVVNAYYHPMLNEIVFPAAILQYPFFDPRCDDAVNFGAMGVVVGHEMTHGFDDKGRKYDWEGNLRDWWGEEDAAEFTRRAAVIVAQASQHLVHGKAVQGELTQGENIADLGGLKLAHAALLRSQAERGAPAGTPAEGPWSTSQRFFLGYAQLWRQNIKKERALQLLTIDPHGPADLRVNGPLSNMEEFHAAFEVAAGAMWRPKAGQVDIW